MPTGYPHITRDQHGVLRINGTGYKAASELDEYANRVIYLPL